MFKVIIVDDEPIIVEGMRKVIPWGEFGCEVIGTAEDGHAGAELIRELKPDIVFTDIYMPGMDGLSMIAAVKSEYPEIEISILSGFSNFSYAQDAIRLGVARYLVKPSKLDEIREAVEAMVGKLKEKDLHLGGQEEETAAGSFVIGNAIKYLKENYMQQLRLNDVAEQVYVSHWHLSRLLNQHAGQGFNELLNHIRIEKAKELLVDPGLKIGEIAEQVGFQDLTHFAKVFKRQEGMTANDFRNRLA